MALIYLVRHGQADSLGINYDQLTDLGHLQSKRLGEYFLQMRIEFDYTASGTLKRQRETLEGIRNPLQENGFCLPEHSIHDELNEFDGEMWKHIAAVIAKSDPSYKKLLHQYIELQKNADPQCRVVFLDVIQRILREWVDGGHRDIFSFDDYHDKVISILNHIPEDANSVLLASSATPVAILAGYSLGLEKINYLPLMRSVSNTSYNIFDWKDGVLTPVTINSYPHIRDPDEFSAL